MNIQKFELWVHDNLLKNDKIRHFLHRIYQRTMWLLSPKFKSTEGIERVTPDDGYEYFFGYYDKCPWSPNNRYILALRVKNSTKKADSSEKADIVTIDLENNKTMTIVAQTHCWNVQQGCMAQWIDDETIIYNDFRDKKYCSVIKNIITGDERIIDMPIYALSNDKKTALTLDFSRLHRLRPGYGYCNIEESTKNEKCPDSTCIWKINIEIGEIIPLLKYTDFLNFEQRPEMVGAEHKVNHLMINPSGDRFMVLHRWFKNKIKYTRLVTCNIDGTDMYNLSDDDFVSHCCWKNDKEIVSYLNKEKEGKGYYFLTDKNKEYKRLWKELIMDGHPTCSPNGEFVVTDSYPDRRRIQSIWVMKNTRVYNIAKVFSPFKFGGDVRCDLHPRWCRGSDKICFDGTFSGKRGLYTVNLPTELLQKKESTIHSDTPLVSVIIPCYNCESTIDETLESLENQVFKNFVVICVNDGSKDNTLSKLNCWREKGTLNLKIIDQENGGVSKARNRGIAEADTEHITFCDSDDLYHEDFLESLVTVSTDKKTDTSYCLVSRNREKALSTIVTDDFCSVQDQNGAMMNLLYRMGDISFVNYLYSSAILKKNNIYFDLNTKYGEDREFNWKYLCHCQTVGFINAPLYWYRVNTQSVTQVKATWRKTDLLSAVKRVEEYLDETHCPFTDEFKSYMYARSMWAVAKTFAVSKDKDLFKRLRKEYDVRKCMKRTAKDKKMLVKIASMMYLISPGLFYSVIKIASK